MRTDGAGKVVARDTDRSMAARAAGRSTVCDRDSRVATPGREMVFEPLHHLVVRGTRVALLAVRELEAQELLPQKR